MSLSVYSDGHFMKEAYKEALHAYDNNEVPVGAVVVCKNRIIARASNQTEVLKDCTAHAEMLALTSAFNFMGSKYLPDCDLYVTLEPCVMCAGALHWSQIKRVIYGASDKKKGFSLINNNLLHPKTKVVSGVMEKESEQLLQNFFNKLRN
ncbi:nucleoside deaminase [Cytophagaceae bacterium ABcell3]|nr:nucleoside deaminase [Cytophagaceae bacterium ABcell3]